MASDVGGSFSLSSVGKRPKTEAYSSEDSCSDASLDYTQNLRMLAMVTTKRRLSEDSPVISSTKDLLNSTLKQSRPEAASLVDPSKIISHYTSLPPEGRQGFLKVLATDYGVNHDDVKEQSHSLIDGSTEPESVSHLLRREERLRRSLVPRYQQLFLIIGKSTNGVKFLVDMRADILALLTSCSDESELSHLQALSLTLRELLTLWFNVGFLQLQRITWESSCDILQKISDYEAVHPIRNWTDLKRRVGPYRRCYVFTHSSMPREPVVVLHTALTTDISNSIQSIVHRPGHPGADFSIPSCTENHKEIQTAVFYSITSTQKGLYGIELGNYLIKSVVKEIQSEFPHVAQFSSLSPIPGYRDWLLMEITKWSHLEGIGELPPQNLFTKDEVHKIAQALGCSTQIGPFLKALKKTLSNNSWYQSEGQVQAFQQPLMRLATRYLYIEKRRGYALNPVANFHLRNGATMWRLNWLADCTAKGLTASCSVMVNYRYFLERTDVNCRNYQEKKVIDVADQVLQLL